MELKLFNWIAGCGFICRALPEVAETVHSFGPEEIATRASLLVLI